MTDQDEIALEDEPVVVQLTDEPWMTTFSDNTLLGATLPQLLRCLWPHRHEIGYRIFAVRLCMLVLVALFNTFLAAVEWIVYSRAVFRTKIPPRPLFIIGHPRSGTTLLHNLLSLDDHFITPTTFQVGFHSCFLTMQRFSGLWPFTCMLSPTRPMDSMSLSWNTPCEDECATYVMSGGASPYMALHFLKSYRKFMPYISFKCATAAQKFTDWKHSFLMFLRKVSYLSKPHQRLLLKSPCHTGRVNLLNAMFKGEAQFILVHRHPEEVFQSSCDALVDKYFRPCAALQRFSADHSQQYVLEQGRLLQKALKEDIPTLEKGNIAFVAFEKLVDDPDTSIIEAYSCLGLSLSDEVRSRFSKYKEEHKLYKRNKFQTLSSEARAVVRRQWREMYEMHSYE